MSLFRDWLRALWEPDEGTYRQQLDKFAQAEIITDGPAHRQSALKGVTAKVISRKRRKPQRTERVVSIGRGSAS